ncbi:MAG: F0F1 ATP synthase subunit epsilon [Candidatus Omnitrophica bacterium]|nr:F0F1 ATP synthase subunit epsilon [Candidatus Omnitrophota bacterium]
MTDPIRLKVLTEAGLALEDSAVSIIAPGERGYFGILRNHAPLLTTLGSGTLTWRHGSGQTQIAQIGDGFLEVVANQVTLLTSRFEQPAVAAHAPASH